MLIRLLISHGKHFRNVFSFKNGLSRLHQLIDNVQIEFLSIKLTFDSILDKIIRNVFNKDISLMRIAKILFIIFLFSKIRVATADASTIRSGIFHLPASREQKPQAGFVIITFVIVNRHSNWTVNIASPIETQRPCLS